MDRLLIGVDFTSSPSRRKPVVVACGRRRGRDLVLGEGLSWPTLEGFGAWLRDTPEWLGGFDLPFGLPRELVETWGWPTDWAESLDRFAATDRAALREAFRAFCDARPAGRKFAHRACDGPAGSSPSMKWVNPPVAWMMHAGVPLLRAAGAWLPAHEPLPAPPSALGPPRIALEAYPALLARDVVGRQSYKSDTAAQQNAARREARAAIVHALADGRHGLGPRLRMTAAQRQALVADARGDALDAVLCLVQVAAAADRPDFGLPDGIDALEGWIIGCRVPAGEDAAP